LENGGGKDNEVFRRVWKTVKTEVEKTRVIETKTKRDNNKKKEGSRNKRNKRKKKRKRKNQRKKECWK